ncbi:MAG: hypothetical protein V1798_12070 [Pseudomonadota bacterium]
MIDGSLSTRSYASVLNYENAQSKWEACGNVTEEKIAETFWYLTGILLPGQPTNIQPLGMMEHGIYKRTLTINVRKKAIHVLLGGADPSFVSPKGAKAQIESNVDLKGDLTFGDVDSDFTYGYACRMCSERQMFCRVLRNPSKSDSPPDTVWRLFYKAQPPAGAEDQKK